MYEDRQNAAPSRNVAPRHPQVVAEPEPPPPLPPPWLEGATAGGDGDGDGDRPPRRTGVHKRAKSQSVCLSTCKWTEIRTELWTGCGHTICAKFAVAIAVAVAVEL